MCHPVLLHRLCGQQFGLTRIPIHSAVMIAYLLCGVAGMWVYKGGKKSHQRGDMRTETLKE
jgi:uncharacterized membrane protein YuzA (DUF378 family)